MYGINNLTDLEERAIEFAYKYVYGNLRSNIKNSRNPKAKTDEILKQYGLTLRKGKTNIDIDNILKSAYHRCGNEDPVVVGGKRLIRDVLKSLR